MEYKDRLFVESLERGFEVLRAFEGHESLGLAEIAEKAGITRSAAQRFTHTLEVLGFLRRDAARRWRLTPRTLEFGTYYLAADPLIAQATPHLVDLNNDCGETVNLSRPDGLDMVFLGRFTANRRSFIHMPQGMRVPMFCGATGRAYLATLPRDAAQEMVERSVRRAFTPSTQTDPDRIMEAVDAARERGFATAAEQFYVGDLNIACAIVGTDGTGLGAVNISCPTSRWSMADMERELAPRLIETVGFISSVPAARADSGLHHSERNQS